MKLAPFILLMLAGVVQAQPTISADPVGPGLAQPTSCTIDANGRPIPCTLFPTSNGFVQARANAYMLTPGTYQITMTYANAASTACTGGPAAYSCEGGGGPSTSPPITLTITIVKPVAATPSGVRVISP